MNQTLWMLIAAYVGLGVLVLALNIRSGWPLWIRLGCIVAVSALYFVTWQALGDIRGWPTRGAVPAQFELNAASVIEPDRSASRPGQIFIWVTPIVDDQSTQTPRAFELPYTRALHTEINRAVSGMRDGRREVGSAMREHIDNPSQASNPRSFAPAGQQIEIHDLPEPTLPEK